MKVILMSLKSKHEILAKIPQVEALLKTKSIEGLVAEFSHTVVVEEIRKVLSRIRRRILSEETEWFPEDALNQENLIKEIIEQTRLGMKPNLHGVINGTGTILHTNLGRAILSPKASRQVLEIARRYSNLEIDEESGKRGLRYDHVSELLCRLTGAEDAMVVNNNAAAVLLVLSALGQGREVVVSRGQLIEIGGSFRIPEVMEQSGCILVEVGSTNKTKIEDYAQVIGAETALLLKAHTSNYKVVGFTAEVSNKELVALAQEHDLPVVEDLGSGILVDLSDYGLAEPTVQSSLDSGIDVVTISGDKLLGGPQAGIILGKKKFLDKMKLHPLNRALRIDKLTLAALEATLREYLDEKRVLNRIPVLAMLTIDKNEVRDKTDKLWLEVTMRVGELANCQIVETTSTVGGGSMPLSEIPSYALSVLPKYKSLTWLDEQMRKNDPPVFARIFKERYLLDLRTVQEDEIQILADALVDVLLKSKEDEK